MLIRRRQLRYYDEERVDRTKKHKHVWVLPARISHDKTLNSVRVNQRLVWRRRAGSNRCIAVLQTAPLPLGYGAPEGHIIVASFSGTQHKTIDELCFTGQAGRTGMHLF